IEDRIARIESDHEYLARHPAFRIEPAGVAVVKRKRGRHLGKRKRLIQSPPRKTAGLRLKYIGARCHHEIEPHRVIEQEAALRHRHVEAELKEDQQYGEQNSADRKDVAALLMGQNPPCDKCLHGEPECALLASDASMMMSTVRVVSRSTDVPSSRS